MRKEKKLYHGRDSWICQSTPASDIKIRGCSEKYRSLFSYLQMTAKLMYGFEDTGLYKTERIKS